MTVNFAKLPELLTQWKAARQRKEVSRRVLDLVEAKYLGGFDLGTSRVPQ